MKKARGRLGAGLFLFGRSGLLWIGGGAGAAVGEVFAVNPVQVGIGNVEKGLSEGVDQDPDEGGGGERCANSRGAGGEKGEADEEKNKGIENANEGGQGAAGLVSRVLAQGAMKHEVGGFFCHEDDCRS